MDVQLFHAASSPDPMCGARQLWILIPVDVLRNGDSYERDSGKNNWQAHTS